MEISDKQKKRVIVIATAMVSVATIVVVTRSFQTYVWTKVVAPPLSDVVVGGRLNANLLTDGEHWLEFMAQTTAGRPLGAPCYFHGSI